MAKPIGQKEGDGDTATSMPLTCGLIMPISNIDGCPAEHWADVKSIVTEAVERIASPKFIVRLVSDADDVGVIQKRIVQNVYISDVVVCDVSGKNPNVMFELGLRLAFDKPTVIIKDDKTDYSFDTGVIEHVSYPRDLRFNRMVTFQSVLADKVLATHRAAKADPNHSTFLKNFGEFRVAGLSEHTVPAEKFMIETLSDIQNEMSRLRVLLTPEPGEKLRRVASVHRVASVNSDQAARVRDEVTKYIDEHPTVKLSTLMDDNKFIGEIARRCEAPRYFTTGREFLETLDNAITEYKAVHI
jgi:hypothetical protein